MDRPLNMQAPSEYMCPICKGKGHHEPFKSKGIPYCNHLKGCIREKIMKGLDDNHTNKGNKEELLEYLEGGFATLLIDIGQDLRGTAQGTIQADNNQGQQTIIYGDGNNVTNCDCQKKKEEKDGYKKMGLSKGLDLLTRTSSGPT